MGEATEPPTAEPDIPEGKIRNWFITCNNWTQQTHDALLSLKNCEYLFQHEVGEEGTPHIQGTLMFKNGRSWEQLRNQIGEYWFKRAKNKWACLNYCKKKETRIGEVYYTNIPKYMRKKEFPYRFYWWQVMLLHYLGAPPVKKDRDRIYWLWSSMPEAGKTTFMKWLLLNNRGEYTIAGGTEQGCLQSINNFYEEHGKFPKAVFWTLPRAKTNCISHAAVEQIADGLAYGEKYKGIKLLAEGTIKVVVMGNYFPILNKQSSKRIRVVNIDDRKKAANIIINLFRR